MRDLARMVLNSPEESSMAVMPRNRWPSCSMEVANHSFRYSMLSYFWQVSYSVCISKKPTLSEA